jgi:Tfp pilus assembly protein PilF
LANVYFSEKNNDKAVSVLLQAGNANKQDLKTRMLLATIYEKTGDIDKAIDVYEKMLLIDEKNVLVTNNLAALLSEYKTDKVSIDRALALAEIIKDDTRPVIKDTVGWTYYKAGRLDEATRILSEVVNAGPEINVFNYHLGMAYYKSGNKGEAKKYLEKAMSTDTVFAGRDIAEQTLHGL